MYLLAYAIKNIFRYAGRYILIGVLLLFAFAINTVALVVAAPLEADAERLIRQYGEMVFVQSKEPLTITEHAIFAEFPEIKKMILSRLTFPVYQDIISIDGKKVDSTTFTEQEINAYPLVEAVVDGYRQYQTPPIWIAGIDLNQDPYFNSKTAEAYLISGRLPQSAAEAVLDIGYCTTVWDEPPPLGATLLLDMAGWEFEFTVVGIVDTSSFTEHNIVGLLDKPRILLPFDDAQMMMDSGILTAYYEYAYLTFEGENQELLEMMRKMDMSKLPEEIADNKDPEDLFRSLVSIDLAYYKGFFQLEDYRQFEAFSQRIETYAKENNKVYAVRFTEPAANQLISTYEDILQMIPCLCGITVVAVACVLLIVSAISMHERKYDIGVLLSVGMPKPKIAALFAAENLIFTVGVTALAFAAGAALAPTAAARLLDGVITIAPADVLSVALPMLALAVCLSLAASSISAVAILRYRPMTILRSRS